MREVLLKDHKTFGDSLNEILVISLYHGDILQMGIKKVGVFW